MWKSSGRRVLSSTATLGALGIDSSKVVPGVFSGKWYGSGSPVQVHNPYNQDLLAQVSTATLEDYQSTVQSMSKAKQDWASKPAPLRGEIVRQIGMELRNHREELGHLISLECGKILAEGIGEVQEAIDICDFAVGLSRTYSGAVIPSERPGHVILERWHPLNGHVGIITAFNFPLAVYFWNAAISLVVGNTQLWKPADTTPLIAVASTLLIERVLKRNGVDTAICSLASGPGETIGHAIAADPRMSLVSFTGSTRVGRQVNQVVAGRLGKALLELGGNNATIVLADADQELALRGVLFGAVGTAGQRCTTLRRLFLHQDIYDEFLEKLLKAYKSIKIGDPSSSGTLCGPLHSQTAVDKYKATIEQINASPKSKILCGGSQDSTGKYFVQPTIVETEPTEPFVQEELFAPVMYVMKIRSLEEAIEYNNSVSQGLSSSLFTKDVGSAFTWISEKGSDCGIVNVNIGPSGAEIGGAFGGEKDTGGGRESGSDAWKQYCRRSTCTINFSNQLPLAQGINFG